MSWFDLPHNGYGTYFNPEMVFTFVGPLTMIVLKDRCKQLDINYERWFFSGKNGIIETEELHESLEPGIIVYYPQYNCIRNADHMTNVPITDFPNFLKLLRRHPKHLGSFFIKTKDTEFREVILTWFKTRGYRRHPDIPLFSFDLAVLIIEPLKVLMCHSNKIADENEEAGNYPTMTYEDFKIYMQ